MFNVRKLMFSWKDLLAEVEPSVIKVRDHTYITSTFLWTSSDPPTHYSRVWNKRTPLNKRTLWKIWQKE